MGIHFGLIAVRGTIAEFKLALGSVWPNYEITASQNGFTSGDEVWSWMASHEQFVSSAEWSIDNPGTQCGFLTQSGPWVIFMDRSYLFAADQDALSSLSERFGEVLSFVMESTAGCAFFWRYEDGALIRSILNHGVGVEFEGVPLPEEQGINVAEYYMEEAESLMAAFGLPLPSDLPDCSATLALALTDRTDYSDAKWRRAAATEKSESEILGKIELTYTINRPRPWWKFW